MNSELADTIEIDDLEAGFDKLKENFENGTSLNAALNATSFGSSLGVTIATELKNKIDEMIDKTLEETEEENNNGTAGNFDTDDYDEGTKNKIFSLFFYGAHF